MAERCAGLLLTVLLCSTYAVAQRPATKSPPATPQKLASTGPVVLEPKQILNRESPAIVEVFRVDQSGKPTAFGSGFIVRSNGIVVTNFHVIAGAYDAQIKLKNGEIYENALVLDYDVRHDVVLLKIRATGLPTVTLGESAVVETGDRAYAIGCPEGYDYTISDGLISARRVIEGTEQLQISVPISHGSSGGPLYNTSGQVIGITTAGIMEGAQNINFAVPLKYATVLLDSPPKNLTLDQVTKLVPPKPDAAAAANAAPSGGADHSNENTYTDPTGTIGLTLLPGWRVENPPPEHMLLSVLKGDDANLLAFSMDAYSADDGYVKNKAIAWKIYGRMTDYSKKVAFDTQNGRRICLQGFESTRKKRERIVLVGALQNGNKVIGIMAVAASDSAYNDVIEVIKTLSF